MDETVLYEYRNPADLLGIDETEALSDYLNSLNPLEHAVVLNKFYKGPIASHGSRAEFEKFLKDVPQLIVEQLSQGKLRLADMTIYNVKPMQGNRIKMFEPQDVRILGLRNIGEARLPKNMALLVSGIYLLQGQAVSLSDNDVMTVQFESLRAVEALANGESTLKVNRKHFLPENISNRKFVHNGYDIYPAGYYKLDNPRIIADDEEISFEIELGSTTGIPANTVLYIGLHGTATIP